LPEFLKDQHGVVPEDGGQVQHRQPSRDAQEGVPVFELRPDGPEEDERSREKDEKAEGHDPARDEDDAKLLQNAAARRGGEPVTIGRGATQPEAGKHDGGGEQGKDCRAEGEQKALPPGDGGLGFHEEKCTPQTGTWEEFCWGW
jgi:hypothetical protein